MLFYIWFCLIWLYKAVEKTSWTFPLSAVLTVPLNQKFKGKIQLLLGFLSNPELKIWVWDGDRQKFICHFVLISVEFRCGSWGLNSLSQDHGISWAGRNHEDHPVQLLYRTSRIPAWCWCWSVFLGPFSPFGFVSAGILPNPGNSPVLWNCSCLSGWCPVVPKDGDRSCWNKCQLVVLTGLKLVFHDGNPGSQGDLELKTELFYY